MTTARKLTYGEVRSNAEMIVDEIIEERVIAGMEVLREKYGEDWVEHIDLESLDLSKTTRCVLGQVYKDAPLDSRTADFARSRGYADGSWAWWSGYDRGLLILDGEVYERPWNFGFATEGHGGYDYPQLQEAWETAFGK